ncbi:hypothetical protein G7046_g5684 [Stylonectria norvegica]|nr:hypothetical protein G7046_g5684 [Stylonectria norvegica]
MTLLDHGSRPFLSLTAVFTAWKAFLLAIALGAAIGPNYDTSTSLFFEHVYGNATQASALATRLTRWDALYYMHDARLGKIYEQEWAFGSGMPTAVSGIGAGLRAIGVETSGVWEPLLAIAVAHVSHFIAVLALYQLTVVICNDRKLAFVASIVHILSPAGLFLSSPSAESLFSCLSFVGNLLFALALKDGSRVWRWNLGLIGGGISFGIATTVRSNGLFGGVLFAVEAVKRLSALRDTPSFSRLLRLVAPVVGGLCVAAGAVIPQAIAWKRYCAESATNGELRPWCSRLVPSIYTFVQEEYWNVGFLRYWTSNQIPMFLLASPMLAVMIKSGVDILREPSQGLRLLGPSTNAEYRLFVRTLAASQALLAVLAITNYHVQIITRLSSGYPVWYWWVAACLMDKKRQGLGYGIVVFIVMYAGIQGESPPTDDHTTNAVMEVTVECPPKPADQPCSHPGLFNESALSDRAKELKLQLMKNRAASNSNARLQKEAPAEKSPAGNHSAAVPTAQRKPSAPKAADENSSLSSLTPVTCITSSVSKKGAVSSSIMHPPGIDLPLASRVSTKPAKMTDSGASTTSGVIGNASIKKSSPVQPRPSPPKDLFPHKAIPSVVESVPENNPRGRDMDRPTATRLTNINSPVTLRKLLLVDKELELWLQHTRYFDTQHRRRVLDGVKKIRAFDDERARLVEEVQMSTGVSIAGRAFTRASPNTRTTNSRHYAAPYAVAERPRTPEADRGYENGSNRQVYRERRPLGFYDTGSPPHRRDRRSRSPPRSRLTPRYDTRDSIPITPRAEFYHDGYGYDDITFNYNDRPRENQARSGSRLDLGPKGRGETRFFLVKSNTELNVFQCHRDGIWVTQKHNARMLAEAFRGSRNVILFFSVNQSSAFQGYAKMTTPPDDMIPRPAWAQLVSFDTSSPFRVDWISKETIHSRYVSHIRNPDKNWKSVSFGRDGMEYPEECGRAMIEAFDAVR